MKELEYNGDEAKSKLQGGVQIYIFQIKIIQCNSFLLDNDLLEYFKLLFYRIIGLKAKMHAE